MPFAARRRLRSAPPATFAQAAKIPIIVVKCNGNWGLNLIQSKISSMWWQCGWGENPGMSYETCPHVPHNEAAHNLQGTLGFELVGNLSPKITFILPASHGRDCNTDLGKKTQSCTIGTSSPDKCPVSGRAVCPTAFVTEIETSPSSRCLWILFPMEKRQLVGPLRFGH